MINTTVSGEQGRMSKIFWSI